MTTATSETHDTRGNTGTVRRAMWGIVVLQAYRDNASWGKDRSPYEKAESAAAARSEVRKLAHTLYDDELRETSPDTLSQLFESDVDLLLENSKVFAHKLRYFSRASLIDEGILAVYRHVADIRREQHWATCDNLLGEVNVDAVDLELLVSLLMATATLSRDSLPHWEKLYDSTHAKYIRERGQAEASAALDPLR